MTLLLPIKHGPSSNLIVDRYRFFIRMSVNRSDSGDENKSLAPDVEI